MQACRLGSPASPEPAEAAFDDVALLVEGLLEGRGCPRSARGGLARSGPRVTADTPVGNVGRAAVADQGGRWTPSRYVTGCLVTTQTSSGASWRSRTTPSGSRS